MRTLRFVLAGLLAGSPIMPAISAPVAITAETSEALRSKATNANLLLLREVQACRTSKADPFDCLELMLMAAERASGYHSYDEQKEGLPSNNQVAADARKLLLSRYPDDDIMIGVSSTKPVDTELLLQMERASANILSLDEASAGRLLIAISQRLHSGGAQHIASRVLNMVTGSADTLVVRELGATSLEAATAFNNLGAINGVYATESHVDLFRKALAIRTAALGSVHASTAVTTHNLAVTMAAMGRAREAITLARNAHSGLAKALGAGDRRTIAAAISLGNMLAADGDTVQSVPIVKAAVAEFARIEPSSPALARAYQDLARIDTGLTPADRLALLRQAAQILELSDDEPFIAPLRQMLSRAKGYPQGLFLVENNAANVQPGNAQEINLLERVFRNGRNQNLGIAYQRIAREMLDQKRFAEAVTFAGKAVELDPYNNSARVIPAYAAILQQQPGQSLAGMETYPIGAMIIDYQQSGRALHSDVVEGHLMLGLSGMKSYGPFGAMSEFDKAGAIVKQRLSARSNFDNKARRDLETLKPIFRGQVMVYFAVASNLTK